MNLYPWQFEPGDTVYNHFDVLLKRYMPEVSEDNLDVWLCHYVALDIEIECAFDRSQEYLCLEVSEYYSGEEE